MIIEMDILKMNLHWYMLGISLTSCNVLCRLLNGNKLSGSLPDELGNLSKLIRLQVDQNNISGPIPKSFANMSSIRHV